MSTAPLTTGSPTTRPRQLIPYYYKKQLVNNSSQTTRPLSWSLDEDWLRQVRFGPIGQGGQLQVPLESLDQVAQSKLIHSQLGKI